MKSMTDALCHLSLNRQTTVRLFVVASASALPVDLLRAKRGSVDSSVDCPYEEGGADASDST